MALEFAVDAFQSFGVSGFRDLSRFRRFRLLAGLGFSWLWAVLVFGG